MSSWRTKRSHFQPDPEIPDLKMLTEHGIPDFIRSYGHETPSYGHETPFSDQKRASKIGYSVLWMLIRA